jgi:uncharacterized protein
MNHKILLITERDDYKKDHQLMESLKKELSGGDRQLVFYRRQDEEETPYLLDPEEKLAMRSAWVRKPLKAISLFKYPSRWGYFLTWYSNTRSIKQRCKKLESFIKNLGMDTNIVILSRSAGGMIASRIADSLGINKLICLGYPFKHPQRPTEPERFEHLARLKTPFLILQGARDQYGGINIQTTYTLSPQISLAFVDTDHDFKVTNLEWDRIITNIKDFISS